MATALIDRYCELLGVGDVDGVLGLYAPDGEIVRYDGVAATREDMSEYFRAFLDRHGTVTLMSVDQLRDAGDVLMWDALLGTVAGAIQTVDVVVLDDRGLVRRHIPGLRGYWGR